MAKNTIRIGAVADKKLLRNLDTLPTKIRTKIVRSAISKSTTVIKRELIKRVPVGVDKNPKDDDGEPREKLKKSITKRTKTAKRKTGVHGVVGVPHKFPKFVFMLHYGIKAHTIKAPGGWSLNLGFGRVYKSVQHPGVARMDFHREALTASIPKARAIMASQLRSKLASVAK